MEKLIHNVAEVMRDLKALDIELSKSITSTYNDAGDCIGISIVLTVEPKYDRLVETVFHNLDGLTSSHVSTICGPLSTYAKVELHFSI